MSPSQLHDKSQQLSVLLNNFLLNLDVIQKKRMIGAFAPIQHEPVWNLSLEAQLDDFLSFNCFEDQTMFFRKSRLDELVSGSDFGVPILCPKKTAPKVSPEILLIPGLGFSKNGTRLGRGKGFYDQYLSEHKGLIKIGLCFEEQVLDSLPKESHDVDMDFIITDSKIHRIERF